MTLKNDPTFAYRQGSRYEIFMHRAFNSDDRTKPGMSCSYMQNLINAEFGDNILKDLIGSYEDQMIQVKKYMHKSMDKYLKMRKITNDKRNSLDILKQRIDYASTSEELMCIIDQTLDLTRNLINK